jgi:hypothetical protein
MASNYTEFKVGSIIYLRSYNSLVAKYELDTQKLTLGHDWDYSVTTVKHLGMFMNNWTHNLPRGAKEIQKAIDDGRIIYDPEMN